MTSGRECVENNMQHRCGIFCDPGSSLSSDIRHNGGNVWSSKLGDFSSNRLRVFQIAHYGTTTNSLVGSGYNCPQLGYRYFHIQV